MTLENSGSATVNGVQHPMALAPDADNTKTAQKGPQDAQTIPAQPEPHKAPPQPESSVPYARFKEVVEARKAAEEALASVVDEVVATLPEDMRELVPNLPPAEKIRWINTARQKGFFVKPGSSSEPDSPGSKRPGGKPTQDLSGLTPIQLMSAGYSSR